MAQASFTNIGDFMAGLDLDAAAVDTALLEETQDAANAAVQTAVEGTPVKTGLHRGSYIVGVGSDPGPSGNPLDPDGAPTIAAAADVIATATIGQQIIIVNDGPVIEELNDGRSNRAPGGFLDDAVIAAGRT